MIATDTELSPDVRKINGNAALFCCPGCKGSFGKFEPDSVGCETGQSFPIVNGLPLLNDAIPFGARVLEVGCGTGQLSIFLSLANREVIGADLTPQVPARGRIVPGGRKINQV